MNPKIVLFIILLIGSILRFFNIDKVPPALNWDEASLGYNAYSILKSGKDEWGKSLPLTFEAFGDYKLPVYVYSDVPFIAFFGLNEISIKLPSILSGILAILLTFLISKSITGSQKIGLISAFLIGVSPWHVFLSRIALEANLAFTIFLSAVYLFLQGLKKYHLLSLSALIFGLTIFTYNSARVFIPLFIIGLVIYFFKQLKKVRTKLYFSALVLIFFIGTAGYLAVFEDSSARYFWVTILDQGAINYLNEARARSELPGTLPNLVYNKITYFTANFLSNYFKHFTPKFLVLEGGSNYQFSLPKFGLLFLVELPFLILGLYKSFKSKGWFRFALIWLFLAPIPAAITRESPHALRAIFMLGSLQIITAAGILYAFEYLQKKILFIKIIPVLLVVFLFFTGFISYYKTYFFVYPKNYSQSWQYGMKEVINFLDENEYLKTSKIYITKKYGEPHIFYLLYTGYDPTKYQNNPTLVRYRQSNWRWVDRIDNLYFINDWEVKEKLKAIDGAILVSSPENLPQDAQIIQTINFLDGSKAFDVAKI